MIRPAGGRVGGALATGLLAVALALLVSPLAYAVWISFTPGELLEPPAGDWSLRWYRQFFASRQWTDGLGRSLRVAAESVALALAGGFGLGFAVVRARFRGVDALASAVLLPLFVPAVVLGMGLLPLLRRAGGFGSEESIAAAHALVSLPVVYLMTRTALRDADPELERAAQGLGASGRMILLRITLPLLAPALASGAAMAFVLSLNEFVVALFLGTAGNETLPKVIWPSLRYTLSPLVAAASGVTLALTVAVLLAGVAAARLLAHARGARRGARVSAGPR